MNFGVESLQSESKNVSAMAEFLQLRLVVLSHYLQVFFCIPGGDRQISSINSSEIGAITVGQRSKSGICSIYTVYIQMLLFY